jgi:hypothetical protein
VPEDEVTLNRAKNLPENQRANRRVPTESRRDGYTKVQDETLTRQWWQGTSYNQNLAGLIRRKLQASKTYLSRFGSKIGPLTHAREQQIRRFFFAGADKTERHATGQFTGKCGRRLFDAQPCVKWLPNQIGQTFRGDTVMDAPEAIVRAPFITCGGGYFKQTPGE